MTDGDDGKGVKQHASLSSSPILRAHRCCLRVHAHSRAVRYLSKAGAPSCLLRSLDLGGPPGALQCAKRASPGELLEKPIFDRWIVRTPCLLGRPPHSSLRPTAVCLCLYIERAPLEVLPQSPRRWKKPRSPQPRPQLQSAAGCGVVPGWGVGGSEVRWTEWGFKGVGTGWSL